MINTEANWDKIFKFLINYFKICDDKIPPIQPFKSETFSFLRTQEVIYQVAEEGSLFHKTIHGQTGAEAITIGALKADRHSMPDDMTPSSTKSEPGKKLQIVSPHDATAPNLRKFGKPFTTSNAMVPDNLALSSKSSSSSNQFSKSLFAKRQGYALKVGTKTRVKDDDKICKG